MSASAHTPMPGLIKRYGGASLRRKSFYKGYWHWRNCSGSKQKIHFCLQSRWSCVQKCYCVYWHWSLFYLHIISSAFACIICAERGR